MGDVFVRIHRELTDAFILKEYADRIGIMSTEFREKAIYLYRTDPVFAARVKSTVHGVMAILVKYVDEPRRVE